MNLQEIVSALSEIEKIALKALHTEHALTVAEIAEASSLNIDSVRRAVQWLHEKGLVEVEEKQEKKMLLTAAGKSSLRKGLPEKMFISALHDLGGKAELEQLRKKSELNAPEFNVAMGIAKRNAWIAISKDSAGKMQLELTGLEKPVLAGDYELEKALAKIEAGAGVEQKLIAELHKRGLVEESIATERRARLSAQGEKALPMLKAVAVRAYNIFGPVPKIFIGKRQPYARFLQKIRSRLVALGFQEMESPLITQEFYNFDVLFQPQNHPARSWSDTYQLKQPKTGELPDKKFVERVKAAHENGWKTGSKGWQYEWSEGIASRVMPAAHGTAHSARQIVKGIKVPGKYFAIARCYRPDVVDAKHLIEFNQMEGFIVDESFNFRHLLGMLKQFAIEFAGTTEVKFTPGYFPFTEPSCELYIKHPKLGWIEIAGAGIFRPEMMLPLGIKEPALAWGVGIDRLAMYALQVEDIRYLFSQDLNWLRESRVVQ